MMPSWLPGVLTAVLLSAIGNYLSVWLSVRLQGQAMAEDRRRLTIVEDKKLDSALHYAVKDDLVNRIDTVSELVRTAGHRMNNMDLRIGAVDDRTK